MKYICMPLFNGICNRLIPMMSAIRLAIKTNRKLIVFWTNNPGRIMTYHGDGCLFEDIFKPLPLLDIVSQGEMDQYGPISDFYNFNYETTDKLIVNIDTDKHIFIIFAIQAIFSNHDNPDEYDKWKLRKSGKFEEDTVYKELQEVFKMLKPIDSIQQNIDSVYKNFNQKMIGLHIRRTDGDFARKNWNETDKILIQRCKEWIQNGYKIFLATDSLQYEEMFKRQFEENIITYNPTIDKFQNNKFNVIAGVTDLFLLSKCNMGIIGTMESSFSLVSALLSNGTPLWCISTDTESVTKIMI